MTAPVDTGAEQSAKRLPALDGYRAVAATAVVATHVGFLTGSSVDGRLAPVLSRLDVGVAIFFVLSGFLLYRPFLVAALDRRPAPRVATYLWRRFLRIVPLYAVAVLSAWLFVQRGGAWSTRESLTQVLMLQAYVPKGQVLGLTQMWSLCTEVAFYLVLPWLAFLLAAGRRKGAPAARRQLLLLAGLALAGLVARAVAHKADGTYGDVALLQLPAHLDWFAAGMILCLLDEARRRQLTLRLLPTTRALAAMPAWCLTAALACFVLATTPLAGPRRLQPATAFDDMAKHVLYLAVAVLLVLPMAVPERVSAVSRLLSSPPMRWLGAVSYGIFCFHLVVLEVVYKTLDLALFSRGFWWIFPLVWSATVGLAWLAHRAIEQPATRLRRLVHDPGIHSVG